MKNLLSKTLLCGVLASSFILINCQKAPNRPAPLKIDPAAKPSAAKVGDCTPALVTNIESLKGADKRLQERLKLITAEPTDTDATEVNAIIIELNDLVKNILAALTTLKFDECKIYEGNDPKKKQTGDIKALVVKQMRAGAGAAAKAKTKKDNAITLEDKKESSENLEAKQEFSIDNVDLANALSKKESSRGAVAIVESKVVLGAAAKTELENPAKTACAINVAADSDIKIDSAVKVLEVGAVVPSGARKTMAVKLEIKTGSGSPLIELSCNIAEGKEATAAKEVRSALGNLIKALDRQAVEDKNNGSGSQEAPAKPAPAPGAAGPEVSKASKAEEGLKIIDGATKK